MQTHTTQIRVTLPTQLQEFLATKANRFGLSMSSYIKNLIIDDVKDLSFPVKQASSYTEKQYKMAMASRDKGVRVDDIDQYFDNL